MKNKAWKKKKKINITNIQMPEEKKSAGKALLENTGWWNLVRKALTVCIRF